jgi:hypothetical protein
MLDRRIWLTRRAIGLHVVIIVIVPTFAALCNWQVHRALGGNDLSWAYVFEWPFFAGYAVYMWWRFVHEVPPVAEAAGAAGAASASAPVGSAQVDDPQHNQNQNQNQDQDQDAAERAAYNNYLAGLAARNKRKQWR